MKTLRLVSAALLLAALSRPATAAQVDISYEHKVCVANQDCPIDLWVNSSVSLGNLVVVLHFDNTKLTVVGAQNGGYLSTAAPGQITYANNAAIYSPTLCVAQPTCGFVLFHGLDPSDSTFGAGKLMRLTVRVTATTQILWHTCSCLCNASICVMYPFATLYDGGPEYTLSYSGALIEASGTPPADSDGDCVLDYVEVDHGTDPLDTDSDDDGILDGTCPATMAPAPAGPKSAAGEDLDNDGRVGPGETDPADADSDDDGLFDGTERGLTAPQGNDTDPAAGNFRADADPLTTTDPLDPDSDDDGALDGVEDVDRDGAYEPAAGESDPGDVGSVPPAPHLKSGARVLLLGDGDAETQVEATLDAAGHPTTLGPIYYDWDGSEPDADDFDMVVLLDGYDYGYELQEAASARLGHFVEQGCGLLVTEWTAYDVCYGYKTGVIADLMPTTSAPACDYQSGLGWVMTFAHPLTAGVPASWSDSVYSSLVAAQPGALVVAHVGGYPALTYDTRHRGKVVHLNHTLSYSGGAIHPNALQLMANAVAFASCDKVFTDGFETGDLLDWSSHTP